MVVDEKSKQNTIKFLQHNGYTNITTTDSISEFCPYDINATSPNGEIVLIEIKDKKCPSDKYGDIMCEAQKSSKIKDKIKNGEADKAVVINYYGDDKFAVSSISNPNQCNRWQWCPNSTSFGWKGYEWKLMSLYGQQRVYDKNTFGLIDQVTTTTFAKGYDEKYQPVDKKDRNTKFVMI